MAAPSPLYKHNHTSQSSSKCKITLALCPSLCTGVGIARQALEDPILGEDSHSYAVQINEHPNASCSNTKNRLQIKRSSKQLTHANIGVLLNLDEHFLNLYLNGKKQWILIYLGCGGGDGGWGGG